jgi:DNA-binding transcriptional MerR regulator
MKEQDLVSLNALARELKENKSKLSYYVKMGLLKPITVVGKMQIFDRKDAIETIKNIKKQKNKNKTLLQIKDNEDN